MPMATPFDAVRSAASAHPAERIDAALRDAIVATLGETFRDADPVVRQSQNPEFGDYQANAAMALAKQAGRKPRELAEELKNAAAAELDDVVEKIEVAGPGFLNFRLRDEALAHALETMNDDALGIRPLSGTQRQTIALDFCGVNVAKQMHVGHLRSTIIGDALARVFERVGHVVHRENHLGDWGLPIAMVLHSLRERKVDLDALTLPELDAAYRDAQLAARSDIRGLAAALEKRAGPHRIVELEEQNAGAHAALEAAKQTLVALQRGDAELQRDWRTLIDVTMRAVYEACDLLDVTITEEHNRGESTYRERLPGVIEAFIGSGIGEEDEGAIIVRFDDRERPLLIRKSDGGYLYATTDLAAIRRRVQELGADRVIYVVDARQRDHFRDVFDAAHLIGWDALPPPKQGTAELVHVPFGAVLGEDKKPLKTRSGENVTLRSLLDEAIERGAAEVACRAESTDAATHNLPKDEIREIGRQIGMGAIKYADLSSDLAKDYVFSFERMISFEGNTGPYLQYVHCRISSIFMKAEAEGAAEAIDHAEPATALLITAPQEKALALALLRYPSVVRDVSASLEPHRLCTYLYELADTYNTFYQHCPVLRAETPVKRASRLRLSRLVQRVLADGLSLLGIAAPRRM